MRNRPDGFDIYFMNLKTIRTIANIFVVFLEKLTFMVLPRTLLTIMSNLGIKVLFTKKGKNKYETYLDIFKRYPNLEISREVANTNLDMKKVVSKCAPDVRH